MIQIKQANNIDYNTNNISLELKKYMEQIAITQNLREQLVEQIYIITDIQKAINDKSIEKKLDIFLSKYNDSISHINGAIISASDKLKYFDILSEQSSYEKQKFTLKLANKCKEVESVFDQVATLNAQAIKGAKQYVSTHKKTTIDYSQNIDINNMILANGKLK
jgi:hypothetical protein